MRGNCIPSLCGALFKQINSQPLDLLVGKAEAVADVDPHRSVVLDRRLECGVDVRALENAEGVQLVVLTSSGTTSVMSIWATAGIAMVTPSTAAPVRDAFTGFSLSFAPTNYQKNRKAATGPLMLMSYLTPASLFL